MAGTKQNNQIRFWAGFDPDVYERIAQIAEEDHISMSQVVRELVEWGLEDVDKALNNQRKERVL